METEIGGFSFQFEQPEPIKFAYPIVLLGEFFTTRRHMGQLLGYLATIGWEAYLPDLRTPLGSDKYSVAEVSFEQMAVNAAGAVRALDREAILMGHGVGGLLALKLSTEPRVKSAIALAPLIPGFASPLFISTRQKFAAWRKLPLTPPRKQVLAEFLFGADPHHHGALGNALVADASRAALEVAKDKNIVIADSSKARRLIVAGEKDSLVPLDKLRPFAEALGAQLAVLQGRGHWLIGGRAMERAVGEAHRFLVKTLGQDLLLLFPEEWKGDPERTS